jgi:hypothetical protein
MGQARFEWFLLVSIAAHIIYLWQFNLAFIQRLSFRPINVDLAGSASLQDETDLADKTAQVPGPPRAALRQSPARAIGATAGKAASSASDTGAHSDANAVDSPGSPGSIVTSPTGGIGVGAPGGASSAPGTSLGGGGPAGTGSAKSSALPGSSAAGAGAPLAKPKPTVDEILPKRRHIFHGDVYYDVDSYVLEGVRISAIDLCLDGDHLRTNDPITLTESITDRSLCRIKTRADNEIEYCPPAATKSVIRYAGHLRTPISYSVNVCLVYDNSNCRIIRAGTEKEREVCRPVKYEGLWDRTTNFDYKCQSSETRIYHHSIEYTVRHLVDRETADGRYRRQELQRVRYPIPKCE